jgi:hypothetical protein
MIMMTVLRYCGNIRVETESSKCDKKVINMRTIIEIPDIQIDLLSSLVEQENISRAELIRRAISEYIARYPAKTDNAFGLWKDNKVDGLEYQNKMRDEW